MEEEILELSQRLQDQPLALPPSAGGRAPLAALNPNLNPFGFTHQRNKAARKAGAGASLPAQAGDEAIGATPLQGDVPDAHSARPSPTPFAIFRGRLSFGVEGSARKFAYPAQLTPKLATVAVKRKLTDGSPSGDLMLVFPSVKRPAACKRRCPSEELLSVQMGGLSTAAASSEGEGGQAEAQPSLSGQHYWSDPLPLPSGMSLSLGGAAGGSGEEASIRDTAASSPPPASLLRASGGGMVCPVSPFVQPLGPWELEQQQAQAAPSAVWRQERGQEWQEEGALAGCSEPSSSLVWGSGSGFADSSCCSMDTDPPALGGSRGGAQESEGPAAALQVPFSPLASGPTSSVPLVDHPDCGLPSITPETAGELIRSQGAAYGFSACVVVDCRYGYEYDGGCIEGAVSINTPEAMERFLAESPLDWSSTALILHCEFSSERGPRMFHHVRDRDRRAHVCDYPALSWPHMFVLQGGYKAFHRAFPLLCGAYLPMDHPACTHQLKAEHKAVKAAWAKTKRIFEEAQQRRGRRYVVRPASVQQPPALAAATHPMQY